MFALRSDVDAMVLDWREIDRELRSIAKRQRALDAEEAALLCVVSRQQVWRQFGCATMLEYLELIFGYGPKVGYERVRVALAIDELPELREALATGEVSYSALRELTRVTTPNTQREWLDAVRGKSVREIEDLVRTHRKGDLPTDPGDPDLKPRRLTFEVSTATSALLREARQSLANERGRFIEDDEFVAAMAAALLEGGAGDADHGRAKYQVRVTMCASCSQTYFEGGGRKIAVDEPDAARADCDAQRIGPDHRAAQDIAPKTRRAVMHRDGGRCTVPRCRSSRFIEVHHIVPHSEGGSHDASNLTCLCDGHHVALHEHKLVISGSAPNISVRFANDPAKTHVEMRHMDPKPEATQRKATHVDMRRGESTFTAIPHEPLKPTDAELKRLLDVETLVEMRHIDPKPAPAATQPKATYVEAHRESTFTAIPDPKATRPVASRSEKASSKATIPHVETSAKSDPKATRPVASRSSKATPVAIPHVETSAKATHVEARHVKPTPIPHIETPTAKARPTNAYSLAVMTAEAKQALRGLGFPAVVAIRCVASALANQPPTALEQLIRDALQYSRQP